MKKRKSSFRKKAFMYAMGFSSLAILLSNYVEFPKPYESPAAYTIRDLGVGLYPNRVNNSGFVVGIQVGRIRGTEAFVWEEESGLDSLGIDSESLSFANDISDRGLVVGHIGDTTGVSRAYTWLSKNLEFDFTPFKDGHSVAYGVNDQGHMVGQIGESPLSNFEAFHYQPGTGIRPLGTLGGSLSQATSLNDHGQVVGWSVTAERETHAFRWDENGGMIDLGTLGGSRSLAGAINDRGWIVGQSQTEGGSIHAALFRDDRIQDLGTLGGAWSLASDINEEGVIVGQADTKVSTVPEVAKRALDLGSRLFASGSFKDRSRAIVWSDGECKDLNLLMPDNSGWASLSAATGVNDRGQIVGFGNKDGHVHGFLLTPVGLEEEADETVSMAMNTDILSTN